MSEKTFAPFACKGCPVPTEVCHRACLDQWTQNVAEIKEALSQEGWWDTIHQLAIKSGASRLSAAVFTHARWYVAHETGRIKSPTFGLCGGCQYVAQHSKTKDCSICPVPTCDTIYGWELPENLHWFEADILREAEAWFGPFGPLQQENE